MKTTRRVNSNEVNISPFVLNDFARHREDDIRIKKVSKKLLKQWAEELGLSYDEKQITFTKKILTAYLGKIG